jgi:hypothetical protein
MIKAHEAAARCSAYPAARSWFLANIRRIKPIPMRGRLGIFDVPIELEDLEFV